jgi:phosphoribosylformylglycinamidine cyclo-ligase
MAHITGGGLIDNIPRILPAGVSAVIQRGSWRVPPVFTFIQEAGKVADDEMHRVFNMGVGFMIVVRQKDVDSAMATLKASRAGARLIGQISKGNGDVLLVS